MPLADGSCCIGIALCCDDAGDAIGNIDTRKATVASTTDASCISATIGYNNTTTDGNGAAFTKFTTTYTRGRVATCGCNSTTIDGDIAADI